MTHQAYESDKSVPMHFKIVLPQLLSLSATERL